jgi:hypothetical protein
MAIEIRSNHRAAALTLAYLVLCVIASLVHSLIGRVDGAVSQSDEAMSKSSAAAEQAEQNESDISDLQDNVTQLQNDSESQ